MYENNRKNKKLDAALFKSPTSEYRGAPFWAWNCKLEKEELLRQIDVFEEMGFGGVNIHARYGLATPYLSDEFMELVGDCHNKIKSKGMYTWLYDEDKWPSGFGGGFVTEDVSYRQRFIVFTCNRDFKPRSGSVLVGRYDIVLDENGCLEYYKRLDEGEEARGDLWSVWRMISLASVWHNNKTYVDTLNPRAIERFTEITHERYYNTVGEDFGKSIPAVFTDEPQFFRKCTIPEAKAKSDVRLPWTDDLEATYFDTYGESLVDRLPELIWELPDGRVSVTRYRYHDHIAERFVSAYADTLGRWCRAHGIALTGHMATEATLSSQTSFIGDCMRSYRSFDIPGIDILCEHFEFTTAKQCQSAARQYGREAMLSELYGVTGWDYDFRGYKLQGDWQAALGVTVRVPHLSWVSMKGVGKRDYPASISYQSPWYKEFGYVEEHFARVNTALVRGEPQVRVGVIHPVETFWLHFGPDDQTKGCRDRLNSDFTNLANWLVTGNVDFDYINESLLTELCGSGGAPLKVGKMAYDAIIVPACETLRSTTLDRLEAFAAEGGKLVFMGEAPKYADALPSERGKMLWERSQCIGFNKDELLSSIEAYRTVDIRTEKGEPVSNLLHQIRRDEGGTWLFVAHGDFPYNKDIANYQDTVITVKGTYKPVLWDTLRGETAKIAHKTENGRTRIFARLYDFDSLLLFLEDADGESFLSPAKEAAESELRGIPDTVEYTLSEPNVLILDVAEFALDGEALQGPEEVLRIDAELRRRLGYPASRLTPWVLPDKAAEHSVTLEFTVHSDIELAEPYLALEDASDAEILWNGKTVENKICGYYVDKAIQKIALPPIEKGDNVLRVTLPFGEKSNCEAMYLLGSFGVKIAGRRLTLTNLPEKLGFSDITYQGLPFYGGEVSYHIPLKLAEECDISITVPHYTAAVNTVFADGEKKAVIAYPPYRAELGATPAGEHTVTVTSYISRRNCFGDLHNADEKRKIQSASAMKTTGSSWTYEYRLRRAGIISTPIFTKKERE